MSLDAYKKQQIATEDPRHTEYRLFGQVTGALMTARDNGQKDRDFFAALDWNRRLWSTLSNDCATRGNALPEEVRAGIISLAIWVSKYTSQVARSGEDIQALIDINRTIMEGLRPQSSAAAPS